MTPSASVSPSDQPSVSNQPSASVSPSDQPSVSNQPSASLFWRAAKSEEYEVLSATDPDVQELTLGDNDTALINLGFNYNWFGNMFTKVCLSSNGQINMGEDSCDNSFGLTEIGDYVGKRIAFVQEHIDPREGGSVKYLIKSSPSSIKIAFEDVKFYYSPNPNLGGNGLIQVQVELFENGNILLCYGEGDNAENTFAAGVEDSTIGAAYPIPDSPFDGDGFTSDWPADKCWKFVMPVLEW